MSRPRRRLWKRPGTSYRLGDRKPRDPGDESIRLTLYLPGRLLDLAERLTVREGAGSIQVYCETLLTEALATERARHQLDDAEARHGPMEGLRAIADDPEYLAEWTASILHRDDPPPIDVEARPEVVAPVPIALTPAGPGPGDVGLSEAAATVIHHAGLEADPGSTAFGGFLACLRRGTVPPVEAVEDLAAALVELDRRLEGVGAIDRRLAHALNRLALESQVLHTDAWPDAFDDWTVDAIRAVQAAVERILSGRPVSY